MAFDPRQLRIRDFTYSLPNEKIAQFPLALRDRSKLLFYRNGQIEDHRFSELPALLPPDALLVFNDTQVVQARLFFKKPTGSVIELFCLEPVLPHAEVQLAMQQTQSCVWKCLVGNAKRWKEGSLALPFTFNQISGTLYAEKQEQQGEAYLIKFTWQPAELAFGEVLSAAGNMPLPPYMKREAELTDATRYQTVYAKNQGAVAAPTAGLHFTDTVLVQLPNRAYLTLHVGAGTFKPVKADDMQGHDMHAEEMHVPKMFIENLLQHWPKPVIAVGTTSVRTLESLYWIGCQLEKNTEIVPIFKVTQWQPYDNPGDVPVEKALQNVLSYLTQNQLDYLHASTQIIIAPGYRFKLVSGLVTNFHQPESTLLLLVAALVGDDWRTIYDHALANEYRFLSYGDSSLLMGRDSKQDRF